MHYDIDSTELCLKFRTGAAMPCRLGSEQLKDDITAILELVKNSYDADATEVYFSYEESNDLQKIIIQDNGCGMTLDDLHKKWAWLATENKVRQVRSDVYHRLLLGQKGVGRFAVEKIGHKLVLRTRTEGSSDVLQIKFDWDLLSPEKELDNYEWKIKNCKPEPYEPIHGTKLEIRDLRKNWKKPLIEKLKMQLARLIDPETSTDFKIFFITPWKEINGQLTNPLPGNETHRIEFNLESDGTEIINKVSPEKTDKINNKISSPIFGPIHGKLRYFGQGLKKTDIGKGGETDADWNVGVRIFRDGGRVRPYGEPGAEGDWLQIYRTRYLKGSRFRLKPHYLEGTIHITKINNPQLKDTTSREGLDSNDHFNQLVEYVQSKIVELSELVREAELREERHRTQERYKKALDPLTAGLNTLKSEAYKYAVSEEDKKVKKGISGVPISSIVKNVHWECLDCNDSWKVPINKIPSYCRQYSVGRDDKPTNKPGCGSTNIRRKENIERGESTPPNIVQQMDDVMSGVPAFISGIQIKPLIDWEMGENDEEAEVRAEKRELAINGRHPSFLIADKLDGNLTMEGTAFEELRAVAALTMHVINAASFAWGIWHYYKSDKQFDQFNIKYNELKNACFLNIKKDET